MFGRRAFPMLLVAATLAGALPPTHQQAVKAITDFISRFDGQEAAKGLLQDFEKERIRIGPVPDNDRADTNADTKQIILNTSLLEEIHPPQGGTDFQSAASWAATIKHEKVHAGQSTMFIMASNAQRHLGFGCPHEAEAWSAGIQSLYDWAGKLKGKLSGGTEAEREQAAEEMRGLAAAFALDKSEFLKKGYGKLNLSGWDGAPVSAVEADAAMLGLKKQADQILERMDFEVKVNPHLLFPNSGETYTVQAEPLKGAFARRMAGETAETKERRLREMYTYAWYADGTALGEGSRTLSRKATRNEVIRVEVMDRLARKRDGSCTVTVQGLQGPAKKPPPPRVSRSSRQVPPGPSTAPIGEEKDARGYEVGYWKLETKPVFTRASSTRVLRAEAGTTGFRGTFKMDSGTQELWGTFSPPPAMLKPGEKLRIDAKTNYSLDLKGRAYGSAWFFKSIVNNGSTDAIAAGALEFEVPMWDPNRLTFSAQVEVVVGGYWYGVWQFVYHWTRGRP